MSSHKRDEWMLTPGDSSISNGLFGDAKDRKTSKEKEQFKKPSSRELNPYYKDGGSGLPPGAEFMTRANTLKADSNSSTLDKNKLAAQRIKAELAGDTETVAELNKQISNLESKSSASTSKNNTTDTEIKSLLKQEKESYDDEIAKNISKQKGFRNMDEFSDTFTGGTKRIKHLNDDPMAYLEEERKKAALKKYMKMDEIQAQCPFCLDSERIDLGNVIAMGNCTFLYMPKVDVVDEFHCCIVPTQHTASTLQCDEGVWEEIRNFKKCLLQMAADQGRGVVFLETVTRPDGHNHAIIDCIFLRRDCRTDPKAYFRKALLECDEEWTSASGRLIDTALKGGLRKSIPKNFPYCYVDFRLDQGYAHVIEDTFKVKGDFLKDLTANLMQLERHQWKGSVNASSSTGSTQKFLKIYKEFDWTELLNT